MRKTIAIYLFIFVVLLAFSQNLYAESVEAPTWRSGDVWQYNMTVKDDPNHHYATFKVTGVGEYYDDEGIKHKVLSVNYITNVKVNSDEYGHIYTRSIENRKLTWYPNYRTCFSITTTLIYYDYGRENRTIRRTIEYSTFINQYAFPIQKGESWSQSSVVNTSTAIYAGASIGTPDPDNLLKDDNVIETKSYYFKCNASVNLSVVVADNELYYMPGAISNWTERSFNTLRIVQDDEEKDTDGNYVVEYFNNSVGNIVKRESFVNGELNSSWVLVYYKYTKPGEEYKWKDLYAEDPASRLTLCAGALALFIILLLTFVIIKKRQFEEEKFTKENIESIETKSELIELCEEAGLSPKGSKSQLRKRLLAYAEEIEKEKEAEEEEEIDEEDEFDLSEEEEESGEGMEDERDLEEDLVEEEVEEGVEKEQLEPIIREEIKD